MRMLARPPVAVTAVLHLGDSWKQALKLPTFWVTKTIHIEGSERESLTSVTESQILLIIQSVDTRTLHLNKRYNIEVFKRKWKIGQDLATRRQKCFPIQSSLFPHLILRCAAKNRPPSAILTTKQSTPPLSRTALLLTVLSMCTTLTTLLLLLTSNGPIFQKHTRPYKASLWSFCCNLHFSSDVVSFQDFGKSCPIL